MPPQKKVLRRIAIASATLLSVSALAHTAWTLAAESAWNRRIEELREFARPEAERRARRSVRVEEIWRRIEDITGRIPLDEVTDVWELQGDLGIPTEPPDRELLEARRAWIADVAAPLEEWRMLSRSEEFRRLLNSDQPMAPPFQSMMDRINWVNLLSWQALLEAHDSEKRNRARHTLASALDLCAAYDGGSSLDRAIHLGNAGIVLVHVRNLLAQDMLDPVRLRAELEPRLARSSSTRHLDTVLERDVFLLCERFETTFETPFTLEEGGWLTRAGTIHRGLDVLADVDEAAALTYFTPTEYVARHEGRLCSSSGFDEEPLFVGWTHQLLKSTCRAASQHALARVALALEAYRALRGSLPASLDELASLFEERVPCDPLTEEAFPYQLEGNRARLGPSTWTRIESVDWNSAVQRSLAWEF